MFILIINILYCQAFKYILCGALGQILKRGQTNFLLSLRRIISGSILHKKTRAHRQLGANKIQHLAGMTPKLYLKNIFMSNF